MPVRRQAIYLPLAFLIIALIAFSPALRAGFSTFDDFKWIGGNPALQPGARPSALLPLLTGPFEHLYSPLAHLVWFAVASLNRALGDPPAATYSLDAFAFHFTSLAVHLIASALLYRLLGLLFPKVSLAIRLAGASLFALHPIQVEAITWVSGLKDLLCTMCMLTALVLHTGELSRPAYRAQRVAVVGVFVLLALFSKPTAVVLPFLLVVSTALYAAAHGPNRSSWRAYLRRAALPLATAFALTLPFLYLTLRWQGASTHNTVSPLWRPVIVLDTFGHYIHKLVWPVGFALDYGRTMQFVITHRHFVPNVLTFAGAVALLTLCRDRVLWLAFLLFLLPLGPVSGITDFDFATISVVTDHYAYPTLIGAAILLTRLLQRVFERSPAPTASASATLMSSAQAPAPPVLAPAPKPFPAIIAALLIATLASLTYHNASQWRSDAQLDIHGLSVNPRSALLNSQFAALLHTEKHFGEALAHALRALDTWPDYPQAHYIAGNAYAALGKPAEAVPHYVAAINSSTYNRRALAYSDLADAYAELNKLHSAQQLYQKALELDPGDPTARKMLPLITAELTRRAALDAEKAAATRATSQPQQAPPQ